MHKVIRMSSSRISIRLEAGHATIRHALGKLKAHASPASARGKDSSFSVPEDVGPAAKAVEA